MNSLELAKKISDILEDRHGNDLSIIDLTEKSTIADYFVIATARTSAHVRALCDEVEEALEKEDIIVSRKEGLRDGRWAVLDYDNVLVHVFNADTRDFFCLEKLWKDHKVIKEDEEE